MVSFVPSQLLLFCWISVVTVAVEKNNDSNATTSSKEYCFPFDYTLHNTTTWESSIAQISIQGFEYVNQCLQESLSGVLALNWITASFSLAKESTNAKTYCEQASSYVDVNDCGLVQAELCTIAPALLDSRRVATLGWSKVQMFLRDFSNNSTNTAIAVYQGPMVIKTRFLLEFQGAQRYFTDREKRALLKQLMLGFAMLLPEYTIQSMSLVLEQAMTIPKQQDCRQRHLASQPKYQQFTTHTTTNSNKNRQLITDLGDLISGTGSGSSNIGGGGGTTGSNSGSTGSSDLNLGDISGSIGGSLGNLPGTGGGGGDDDEDGDTIIDIPDSTEDLDLPPTFSVGKHEIPTNTVELVIAAQCKGNKHCTQENLEQEIRKQAGNYIDADGNILLEKLKNDAEANFAKYFDDVLDIFLSTVGSKGIDGIALDINITAILERAQTKISPLESRQIVERKEMPSWVWILVSGCLAILLFGTLLTWYLVRDRNQSYFMKQIFTTYNNQGCFENDTIRDEIFCKSNQDKSIVIQPQKASQPGWQRKDGETTTPIKPNLYGFKDKTAIRISNPSSIIQDNTSPPLANVSDASTLTSRRGRSEKDETLEDDDKSLGYSDNHDMLEDEGPLSILGTDMYDDEEEEEDPMPDNPTNCGVNAAGKTTRTAVVAGKL